jgi:hypothetical protein
MFTRRTLAAGLSAAGLLVLPGAAAAGGFATVGLSSLPTGTAAGEPWDVRLTLLQHGRTPLSGVRPTIRLTSVDGAQTRSFAARPTSRPGVYRARVVFPAAGTWRYVVDDGFSLTHEFAPVRIGAGSAEPPAGPAAAEPPAATANAGGTGGPDLVAAIMAALAAGLLGGVGVLLARRRRTAGAEPAPARR